MIVNKIYELRFFKLLDVITYLVMKITKQIINK